MLYLFTVCSIVLCFVRKVCSVPPDACFAKFRWEDCGKPPTPVMYYWKSGSRCEVGLWRGCLPNDNMFKDEYECVATCIFTPRARPEDYHNYNEIEPQPDYTDIEKTTLINTDSTDSNTTSSDSEVTKADNGNATIVETAGNTTDGAVTDAVEESAANEKALNETKTEIPEETPDEITTDKTDEATTIEPSK